MSNEAPIYAQAVPISQSSNGYMWPWIIVIIILIIVIIILAIWLAVRSSQSSSGGGCRLTGIQGGSILSSSGSISGSWTAIPKEDDKVTLYVSTNPLAFDANGIPISQNVQSAFTTGSNNRVSINSLTNDQLYYAALVATGSDTNHWAIYGPKIVYTQESVDLKGKTFNILDLNSTGGVSSIATYTNDTASFGKFTFNETNFRITDSEGTFLCRASTDPTDTSVKLMDEEYSTANPKLCQWSYNDNPSAVDGQNLWCLTASQNTSNTNTNSQILCLARNGGVLSVTAPSVATTWYNPSVTSN